MRKTLMTASQFRGMRGKDKFKKVAEDIDTEVDGETVLKLYIADSKVLKVDVIKDREDMATAFSKTVSEDELFVE